MESRNKKVILSMIAIMIVLTFVLSISYALFKKEKFGTKIDIIAEDFNYKVTGKGITNNSYTIAPGELKSIRIKVTSLSNIDFKYILGYSVKETINGSNLGTMTDTLLSVKYFSNTSDALNGIINANGSKEFDILIKNNYEQQLIIIFKVTGGFVRNANPINQWVEPDYVYSILEGSEQDRPTLKDKILAFGVNENPATLTTTSKEANENGLFKSTDTNDGSPTYFFRGVVENNYLKFANLDWRIIRINEDGTIRIRLANGINNDQTYKFNSVYNTYDKMYYTNSTLKPIVENWYQTTIGNNSEYASKVVTGNYFCEQAKVKYIDSYTSGNAAMTLYTSYTPSFKCATDGNGKGLVNSQVGLITYDELIHAGGYIYPKIDDTFYLYRAGKYDWSMSPAAFNSSSAIAWRLTDGYVDNYSVSRSGGALPVLNLSADVLVTGNGTSTDPFIIQ